MQNYILLIFLFFVSESYAQVEYSGVVLSSEGERLIAAEILDQENVKVATTDFDGAYYFVNEINFVAKIRYTGFEPVITELNRIDTVTVFQGPELTTMVMPDCSYPNPIRYLNSGYTSNEKIKEYDKWFHVIKPSKTYFRPFDKFLTVKLIYDKHRNRIIFSNNNSQHKYYIATHNLDMNTITKHKNKVKLKKFENGWHEIYVVEKNVDIAVEKRRNFIANSIVWKCDD